MAERDAASRAFAYAGKPREAPGTRPPPLRADARSSQTVKPSCFIPRGTGPITAAVERREASVLRHWTQGARWRLRATITGPPTGAAAPERLSALRSLTLFGEGQQQTSEGECLARTTTLV